MPEGPEVNIIVDGLQPLVGSQLFSITKADNGRVSLFKDKEKYHTVNYMKILNSRIESIYRRAKFICFHFENNYNWVVHLSYTGCFILDKSALNNPRFSLDKVYYFFNSSYGEFYYFDPRGLSHWMVIHDDYLSGYKTFSSTGRDSIFSSREEILETLKEYSSDSRIKIPIKEFLLKQHYIAGIGNIYASEILYSAKIDPRRKLADLSDQELYRLSCSIKTIITSALAAGGSSTNDYFHVDGSAGLFQNSHMVYNKERCPNCGGAISRISQAGRTTYFCERCQQ